MHAHPENSGASAFGIKPLSVNCFLVNRFLVSGSLLAAGLLAGCAQSPQQHGSLSAQNQREIGAFTAKKYGTASPRVASGADIPSGGGNYLVGRPYRIAGHTYYPSEKQAGYSVTGMSSWYGDAFHGRRTANGEIYNKNALSAAHPTMPLPSYARVTNLRNNYSVVVRVNDRGPYHGGRVLDVSERVADALAFKGQGTAHIKVDYVGRAELGGSNDRLLLATLRTDGAPAQLDGYSAPAPVMTANVQTRPETVPTQTPPRVVAAPAVVQDAVPAAAETIAVMTELPKDALTKAVLPKPAPHALPLPPQRPFDLATVPGAGLPIAAYAPAPRAITVATTTLVAPALPQVPRKRALPLPEAAQPAVLAPVPQSQLSAIYFAPAPLAVQFDAAGPFSKVK